MNNNGLYRALVGGYWALFPIGWQPITRETYASCLLYGIRPVEDNTAVYLPARLLVGLSMTVGALIIWGGA